MSGSNEFFYCDENGEKQDADLHRELLDGIHPMAEADLQQATARRAIADGRDPTMAYMFYGDTSRPDDDPKRWPPLIANVVEDDFRRMVEEALAQEAYEAVRDMLTGYESP